MNPMSAHSIISHRMFVAALSHDESEETQKRRPNNSTAAAAIRGRRARAGTAQSSGAEAQQLFLLPEAIEFLPVRT